MNDGSIRIGTKLDLSGVKANIKELERELNNVRKEQAKVDAQADNVHRKYAEEKEFDAQFPEEFSHREDIDKRAAAELDPIIKKQDELNQKEQEYVSLLEQAKSKLQEQSTIAQASKELDSAVKSEAVLDKVKTQEQYNSLLAETKAKMAAIEAHAERIATQHGVGKDEILAANPAYQKLSDTMGVLKSTTKKFGKEAKAAGESAKASIAKASKETDKFGSALASGIKKIGKMSLAIFGIRGAYRAVTMAVSEYLATNEQLGGQIDALKSLFGQVLGPAIEWVVNLIMQAVSAVNSLVYALSGVNVVAKANEAALKKQAKAANAAQTAGFDEMNKLSDTSGSSESGPALLPESTNVDVSFLDPIVNAIKKFGEDMTPTLQTIKDIGGWIWENLLKPLGEWAGTTLLPTTLDFISSGFNALSEVLKALEPMAQWLWDSFLKPIAEWTGGAIIDILSGLADLLDRFANWIGDNQGAVEVCTGVVGAFMAVWTITDIVMWIDKAGGLAGVISILTTKIKASTLAKLADKAEDIAIIALYVKDYVVAFAGQVARIATSTAAWIANTAAKVATTVAEWAQIAATTAWNVICSIATALTTAFGAAIAFLTSPIGLVILAIAALIAIVILIITYWDEIKAAAISCWEWICQTWENVATWFYENVIKPVVEFFTSLWEGIIGAAVAAWTGIVNAFCVAGTWFNDNVIQPVAQFFVGMWDGMKNGAKKAWDGIKSVFSSVASFFKDIFTKAWDGVKKVFSTGGKVFAGIKDGIVSVFKTVVNALIDGINTVVKLPFEGLNGILDKISGLSIAGVEPFSWLTWRAPVPQLPKLAVGGIVNRPGRGVPAIIGEAGAEAVLPLENNTEWMDILAEKIGGNVTIPIVLDGKKIATYVVDIQKKKAFAMNGA